MKKQYLPIRIFSSVASAGKKGLWAVGLLASLACSSCTTQPSPNVFQQILQNITKQETEGIDIQPVDANTEHYLGMLNADGAFPDIDYTSKAQTSWAPLDHLTRLKDMVVSYITPDSRFYGDEHLYCTIVKMLNLWYEANPTSTNWWYHEIGWAQRMGLSLSLMRAGKQQVPDSLEHKILERMKQVTKGPDQKGSQGTGANKMDIALQWIYRTCLQEDKANLEFAIQQFFYPIKFNSGQGIQSDYSYLQHGQQLYTGGYGGSVLDAFLKVAFYIENTPYVDKEKNQLMSEFVRYGNIPFIRGKNMLYNALGRGIARTNGSDRSNLADGFSKLMQLDKEHAATYEASIKRLNGSEVPSYGVTPWHQHFWRSDYTVHQRPEYTMDVRTASTRTARCENGNGENLLGYFLTEGGTGIVRHGNEYNNIFPSWDWSHIPGTTTPSLTQIPLPPEWEHKGQSTFTGGVTDGTYGVTTYQMKNEEFKINTTAKKSWFFFDKEVVCMGSDINSSNNHPIHTTVNQCLQHGNVGIITSSDKEESTLNKGFKTFQDLKCIHHDGISYYFPGNGKLNLYINSQTGSWKDLCAHQSDTPIIQSVFKLWFDHGVRPSNGKYIYYILPNTASATEAIHSLDELETINNEKIQAVYNHSLDIIGLVFHQEGSIKVADTEISSSSPCVAMFTQVHSDTMKVFVADPSYQLTNTTLTFKDLNQNEKQVINCLFKTDVHYAGSTHTYDCNRTKINK